MMPKAFTKIVLLVFVVVCAPLSVASVPDVGAGMEHTVMLKQDGSVWSWGDNRSGQLGNGSLVSSPHPVHVSLLDTIVAISVGGYHTLALSEGGTVWAWGNNREGQIGDGTTTNVSVPAQVDALSGVVAIASGMYHSMALRDDGSVWAWGGNSNGQLGDGSLLSSPVPVLVDISSNVAEIMAGYWDSYALDSSGKIWLWGYNAYAPPQVPSAAPVFMLPVQFSGDWLGVKLASQTSKEVVLPDSSVVLVAKGIDHSVMLRPDGVVLESGAVVNNPDDILAVEGGGLAGAKEVRWTGAVSMSLLPSQAVAEGAVWRVDGRWYSSGDTAYLVEGTHTIEFGAGNGWATPLAVTVEVKKGVDIALNALFFSQRGGLIVELMPSSAGASWRVEGGAWNNSGVGLTGLMPGEYIVEYSVSAGWEAPEQNVFAVKTNETTSATVALEPLPGTVIVNLGPNDVISLGAKWRIGGGRWFEAAMAIVDLSPGAYDIEFAPLDGWESPGSFSINVGAEGLGVSAFYRPAGSAPAPVIVGSGPGPFNPVLDTPLPDPGGDDAPTNDEKPPEAFFAVAADIDAEIIETESFDIGGSVVATIDYVGAASFYTLDAKRGRRYLFHSQSSGSAQVSFYDASGDLVDTFDTSGFSDAFRFIWIAPHSDQYFLKVEFNDGWSMGRVQLKVAARGTEGDFNGDGESDVVGRGESDAISLLYMRNGTFSNQVFTQYQVGSSVPEAWEIKLVDDFDGDLNADILWRAASGHTSVWLMNGEKLGEGSGLTSEYVGGLADGWDIAGSGDFNGDGNADLLWLHAHSGQLAIWMMDGVNVLTSSGLLSRQAGGSVGWRVEGIGDFNGDGRSDLMWRHQVSGRIAVWLMDGLEHADGSGLVEDHFVSQASQWQVVAVADFDADGRSDILWRHARDGYLYLWFMSGAAVNRDDFVTNYVDPSSAWELAQVGDFNGDGKADLLWQEAGSKHLYAWIMDGLHPVGDLEAVSGSAVPGKWTVLGGAPK